LHGRTAIPRAFFLVRRRARVWPLLSTAVVVSVTTVLTYGQQRFRSAAEPAIVVLAAVAVATIAARRRSRDTEDALGQKPALYTRFVTQRSGESS
jgi:hypothetical protein